MQAIFDFFTGINNPGQFIITWGSICAGATAIFIFFRGCWRKAKAVSKYFEDLEKNQAEANEIIKKELTPNGGGSMKDQNRETLRIMKTMAAKQNSLIYLSTDCIFEIDSGGNCVNANRALCDLFGAEKEQLKGLGWLNFVKEEQRHRVNTEWKNGIKSGSEMTSKYTIIQGETGKQIDVKYYAIITRDKGNILTINGKIEEINN